MSGFSLYEIQAKAYQALVADAEVLALVSSRIYDVTPQEPVLPLIALGDPSGSDWGDKTQQGMDVQISVHVWSKYEGRKELLDIMRAVHELLHESTLTTDHHDGFLVRCVKTDTFVEPDGATRHGVLMFQILTYELPALPVVDPFRVTDEGDQRVTTDGDQRTWR